MKDNVIKKLIKKVLNVKRVNIKVDITFWAILPYSETLDYVINRERYTPISTRFLCFSSTVVYKHNKVEGLDIPNTEEFQSKFNNNDRTNFTGKRNTNYRPRS